MENQLLQTRGSVILRKFREPDFAEFYRQGHEPEILKNLCPLFADRLQNKQQARGLFHELLHDKLSLNLIIEKAGKLAGSISCHWSYNAQNGLEAELCQGWVGIEHQSSGVMKTVFPELIRHIFTHTSAILILGHILAENGASVGMATSFGLVERPDLMQWVIKDGQQLKLCHYELPREKWEPVSQSA